MKAQESTIPWAESRVLVTGGSGSFGRWFTQVLLKTHMPRQLVIYSRDEQRQHEMHRTLGETGDRIKFVLGDIRDRHRLGAAMYGMDLVIHAAALKHVDECEASPCEAAATNIIGTDNVATLAREHRVQRVLGISTDKAVHPMNVYGATKLVGERILLEANNGDAGGPTRFSCARFGNFLGSKGSVIPLFLEQRKQGLLTVTDTQMTRFWLTLQYAAEFVLNCIRRMEGGEVFVPKLPSMKLMDLVQAIAPDCRLQIIGLRPGERVHEILISEEETCRTLELDDFFVILRRGALEKSRFRKQGRLLLPDFRYTSDRNTRWMSVQDLQRELQTLTQNPNFPQCRVNED